MNTPQSTIELPELSDAAVSRIERDVFAGIRHEREDAARRASRRRRTGWMTTGAAAAVIVVAAVIAPTVTGLVSGGSGVAFSTDSAVAPASGPVVLGGDEESARSGDLSGVAIDGSSLEGAIAPEAADPMAGREVIASARATVQVEDAASAAEAIGAAAVSRGGYVESMTLAGSGVISQEQRTTGDGIVIDPMPYYPMDGNWVTVRVPADELPELIASLSEYGEVQASAIDRVDVTEQAVDLRARIDAAQASVDRLTELMGQAGSVADLIAAESALSERQAMLESYQQQLASLENQVALSSLTVTLVEPVASVDADPAGFGDGLAAGWNGLIATVNGIVIALGFLLPWLVIVGAVVLAVWGIRRVVTRRRSRRDAASEEHSTSR